MKTSFDGLISRLDTDEERIYELEDVSIETSKTEEQREQRLKTNQQNRRECPRTGTTIKGITYA